MNNKIYYQRKERWLKRELYIKKTAPYDAGAGSRKSTIETSFGKRKKTKNNSSILILKNERADQLSHPLHLVFNKHLWGY